MEIGLMKYLVVALTLILSMSGSVNAEDHNTRWIMIWTETIYDDDEPRTFVVQTSSNYKIENFKVVSFKTESECYVALKTEALRLKKTSGNQLIKDMKIEVMDELKIRAIADDNFALVQFHCLKITLD